MLPQSTSSPYIFINQLYFLLLADVEPPVVDFCESPPIFLVQNSDDLAREEAMVEWDPPIFHDNSLKDVLGGYHQQLCDCLLDKSENFLRSF